MALQGRTTVDPLKASTSSREVPWVKLGANAIYKEGEPSCVIRVATAR